MSTQAILFNRNRYDLSQAKHWLNTHGYHPIKYHMTDNYVRARLHRPGNHEYRTRALTSNIKAIYELPTNGTHFRRRVGGRKKSRGRRTGGALDAVDLFANMVLPALMYTGISYGIYRAVK